MIILILQILKVQQEVSIRQQKASQLSEIQSPYKNIFKELPIYRDSTYSIYILLIKDIPKLVFVAKDSLSEKKRKSKFFVHVYPKDKNTLAPGKHHLAYNFENKVDSLIYNKHKYYISHTILPNIKIEKLNLGQYGYNGNNTINWKIKHLVMDHEMSKILKINNINLSNFQSEKQTF